MAKETRQFGFDTSSLSTAKPLLPNGFYAGVMDNATIEGKEGKQYFKIRKEMEWDKDIKGKRNETGEYELAGMMMYRVILTSKQAIKTLQQDEPFIFGGQIFFNFDKKSYNMLDNVQLGQLLEALDLKDHDFQAEVDFDFDDDIEVPEEFAGVEDIVTKLNGLQYAKELISVICRTINGMSVKAHVIQQANNQDPDIQENALSMARGASCGILSYEEGAEEDLEED